MIWRVRTSWNDWNTPDRILWTDAEGAAAVEAGSHVEVYNAHGILMGWKPREFPWRPEPEPPAGRTVPEGAS